jgi:hypothetical protein
VPARAAASRHPAPTPARAVSPGHAGVAPVPLTEPSGVTPCAYTLFQQPWWLDAVAPGQWHEAVVRRGDGIVARWPYVVRRRFGITALTQPPLTQSLGPWLRPSEARYANRLSEEHALLGALTDELPRFDIFQQGFAPEVTNWLPLYWRGFGQTTRYTYRIERLDDLRGVWTEFRNTSRKNIRNAERWLEIDCGENLTECLSLVADTYRRQGRTMPLQADLVQRLDSACAARGFRRFFFARDDTGKAHAVVYLVWDHRAAYYLMGGRSTSSASAHALTLAMWHAIQFAAGVTQVFDFEGSMREPVERFIRAFGPKQVPYFGISKANARGRIALAFARTWRQV